MNSQIIRMVKRPNSISSVGRRFERGFLAVLMLLVLCDLLQALPCQAQSQASSAASSQAGLQAPAYIGRRRRGRRARYRNQLNQQNRLAAQQQRQRSSELARQQQRGDQSKLRHEQGLARSNGSTFVKEYGTRKGRGMRFKRKSGAMFNLKSKQP